MCNYVYIIFVYCRGFFFADNDIRVQNGILFFFSQMKNVSYDSTKDTITLQPGVHWGEALTQLEPLGVAPMGGRFG